MDVTVVGLAGSGGINLVHDIAGLPYLECNSQISTAKRDEIHVEKSKFIFLSL
jgi:hypothetical protein